MHVNKLDNGIDEPGIVHIPDNSKTNIRKIRDLPLVYADMFEKLEEKFGKFNDFNA